jgi:hypothetical protein
VLTLKTKVTESAKTGLFSFVDYGRDSTNNDLIPESGDFSYDNEYKKMYTDPYWKYDLGKKILASSFVSSYYGEQALFNSWVLGHYTW